MTNNGHQLVKDSFVSAELAGYMDENYFLDNRFGGYAGILANLQSQRSAISYTVYCRAA